MANLRPPEPESDERRGGLAGPDGMLRDDGWPADDMDLFEEWAQRWAIVNGAGVDDADALWRNADGTAIVRREEQP